MLLSLCWKLCRFVKNVPQRLIHRFGRNLRKTTCATVVFSWIWLVLWKTCRKHRFYKKFPCLLKNFFQKHIQLWTCLKLASFLKKVWKTSIWEQVGLFELKLVQNSARKSKFGWIGFSYQERSMQCFRWNLWKTACATVSLLEIKLKKKYRKCQFDKKALCFSLNYWKSACATIYLLEIDRFCQKSAVSIDLPFYVKFVQKNMHNC